MNDKCDCGSGKNAMQCCLPLIKGKVRAKTAEQLMRSRYCAYGAGDEAYLLRTWHPRTRPVQLSLAQKAVKWTGLKVIESTRRQSNVATVEFIARFIDKVGQGKAGQAGQMHERSHFAFEQGQWFYLDGEAMQGDTAIKKLGRNEPCYCGSSKKYKKCCGQ